MPREPDRRSLEAEAYRRLYKTKRWQAIRDATLSKYDHLCQWCIKRGRLRPATVCHHIDKASKDDPATFFDGPFTALCKTCHDGPAQSEEHHGYSKAVDLSGWPTDPRHPCYGVDGKGRSS